MPPALRDIFLIARTEPLSRVKACQRQFVRDLKVLKSDRAGAFVITDPTAMHDQAYPDDGKNGEHPSKSANGSSAFQRGTQKRYVAGSKYLNCHHSQICRDCGNA